MTPAGPARTAHLPLPARMAAVAVVGLGVGVATAVLQRHLHAPWFGLVNAASPWLTAMFAVGALWRGRPGAAFGGLATGVLELVGYYATTSASGYSYSRAILVFWLACAFVGGPVFGLAGRAWRQARRPRGLGASVLPAAWFAEAVVVYAARLGYFSTAAVFGVVGAVLAVLLSLRGHHQARLVAWLFVAFPVGVVAELLLTLVYSQAT